MTLVIWYIRNKRYVFSLFLQMITQEWKAAVARRLLAVQFCLNHPNVVHCIISLIVFPYFLLHSLSILWFFRFNSALNCNISPEVSRRFSNVSHSWFYFRNNQSRFLYGFAWIDLCKLRKLGTFKNKNVFYRFLRFRTREFCVFLNEGKSFALASFLSRGGCIYNILLQTMVPKFQKLLSLASPLMGPIWSPWNCSSNCCIHLVSSIEIMGFYDQGTFLSSVCTSIFFLWWRRLMKLSYHLWHGPM